ncbi:MAG: ferrous iron transport protein A [bacterium]
MGTLLDLPVGVKAEVTHLRGGFGLQRHLASLGIMPGKTVQKITTQPMGGPIMLEVEGARIAIGRGMAGRVVVRRVT